MDIVSLSDGVTVASVQPSRAILPMRDAVERLRLEGRSLRYVIAKMNWREQ